MSYLLSGPMLASAAATASAAVSGDAVLTLIGAICTASIAAYGYVKVAQIQRTTESHAPKDDGQTVTLPRAEWEQAVMKRALYDQLIRELDEDGERDGEPDDAPR